MLDFTEFTTLTFDCYGTLIDWETGILAAFHRVLAMHNIEITDEQILIDYSEIEPVVQSEGFRIYRDVLGEVMTRFAAKHNFLITQAERSSLADSLGTWPAFPDTVAALQKLKMRYKLAVISNTDDDLFAATNKTLQVAFDYIITAQQCKSYKPSINNFHRALERIGEPKQKILHCAESLYHDIAPARKLGIHCIWVNRHANGSTASATKMQAVKPDLEVPDMQTLAELAVK
jgi:2-haloacid dehalogenase